MDSITRMSQFLKTIMNTNNVSKTHHIINPAQTQCSVGNKKRITPHTVWGHKVKQ